jgi:hypothetical protein
MGPKDTVSVLVTDYLLVDGALAVMQTGKRGSPEVFSVSKSPL